MVFILGISCFYHDSAACLLKDGVVVAAAQEERFSRKKHDAGFPFKAIAWCLQDAGITIDDVHYVSFYEKPLMKFDRLLHQHLAMFPYSFSTFVKAIPSWLHEKLRVQSYIRKKLKFKKTIFYLEHHLSHAAASFLPSGFDEAALLTVDGVGEWETTALGKADKTGIHLQKTIHFPHSLGLLYSTVTAHLGFSVNNSEYKVMGLAPYGRPVYYDKFKRLIDVKPDGSFRLRMEYFDYHYAKHMPSKKFIHLFGPTRKPHEQVTQHHMDIAASLQKVLEETLFVMLNHLYEMTKCSNLCLGGGVALNSVANGKILQNTKFKKIFIQPAAGDAGSAMGAALYAHYYILGQPRVYTMDHAYLGPHYSDAHIQHFLDKHKIQYSKFTSTPELLKTTAQLLHKNKVIGWFQGRMEWGPRALGARSILANASNPQMKDILNLKVKHREHFRPFAPVVCEDDATDYFICDKPLPKPTDFMLMVYPVKAEKRKLLPAITHVDGSGRLQTIRKKDHPLYYGVIKEFGKLSKIPILVNTSFNIRGEPIVCNPYDAYKCMMGTGIDYLVMGNFLVKRTDNLRDAWDSEQLATD